MNKLIDNIDIIAGILGLLLGGIIVSIFASQRDIGVVIILACTTYFILRGKTGIHDTAPLRIGQVQRKLLNIAFWLVFTGSMWLWQTQPLYHRPLAYFVLTSILAGIIAIDIWCFDEKNRVWTIILKIFLLSFNIRAGIFYEFPSLSGADTFFHMRIVQDIVNNGFFPLYEIRYKSYPIFHLIASITSILTSLSIKNALFFSVGLNTTISTAFIYIIGKTIAGNKVGLLALLLANMSDFLIYPTSTYIGPDSVVINYLMIMLYILLVRKAEPKGIGVLMGITALTVVTHQLSTFVAAVAVIALVLASKLGKTVYHYQEQIIVTHNYLLLIIVMLLFYWNMTSYYSEKLSFLQIMVLSFLDAIRNPEFGYEAGVTSAAQYSIWVNLLFRFGYLITLFFSIGGILYWLRTKKELFFSIACTVLVLYIFIYGFPALTGTRVMLPDRWFPILCIFLVILASFYIIHLAQLVRPRLASIAIVTLLLVLSFTMIATPNVNKDNPFYAKERAARIQFKGSEVSAIYTLSSIYPGRPVRTDESYSSGILRQLPPTFGTIQPFDLGYISVNITRDQGNSLIILRKSIFDETVSITGKEKTSVHLIVNRQFLERFQSSGYSLVYDDGGVSAYLAHGTP